MIPRRQKLLESSCLTFELVCTQRSVYIELASPLSSSWAILNLIVSIRIYLCTIQQHFHLTQSNANFPSCTSCMLRRFPHSNPDPLHTTCLQCHPRLKRLPCPLSTSHLSSARIEIQFELVVCTSAHPCYYQSSLHPAKTPRLRLQRHPSPVKLYNMCRLLGQAGPK